MCSSSEICDGIAQSCIPACIGDPSTWDAGFGDCSTYDPSHLSNNSMECFTHSDGQNVAAEVCGQCGLCSTAQCSILDGSGPSSIYPCACGSTLCLLGEACNQTGGDCMQIPTPAPTPAPTLPPSPEPTVPTPAPPVNLALNRPTTVSSECYVGLHRGYLTDGEENTEGGCPGESNFWHSCLQESQSWAEVDLGGLYSISSVQLSPRCDCCPDHIGDAVVTIDGVQCGGALPQTSEQITLDCNHVGQVVRIEKSSSPLALAEIEVFGELEECANNDGSAESLHYPCACGNTTCDGMTSSKLCSSALSVCSPSPCLVTDGSGPSIVYPCSCGASLTTCNTGDVCDASVSTCTNLCEVDELRIHSGHHGGEISWNVMDGNRSVCSGSGYGSDAFTDTPCCLLAGKAYTLQCKDSYGDGWNDGYIMAGDRMLCDNFHAGFMLEVSLKGSEPVAVTTINLDAASRSFSSVSSGSSVGWGALGSAAWSPETNNIGEYMQMDLQEVVGVHGVEVQGRPDSDQWVTSFTAQTSTGSSSRRLSSEPEWTDVVGVFAANTDRNSTVRVFFPQLREARFIRIYPQTYVNQMALRAGVLVTGPCNVADGSGFSSAYPCKCGSAQCTANDFCSADLSQCDKLPCSVSDGSYISESYPCSCGSATCDGSTSSQICDAASNTCSAASQCDVTDASAASSIFPCACGDAVCAQEELCQESQNLCAPQCSVEDASSPSSSYPCMCNGDVCDAGELCDAGSGCFTACTDTDWRCLGNAPWSIQRGVKFCGESYYYDDFKGESCCMCQAADGYFPWQSVFGLPSTSLSWGLVFGDCSTQGDCVRSTNEWGQHVGTCVITISSSASPILTPLFFELQSGFAVLRIDDYIEYSESSSPPSMLSPADNIQWQSDGDGTGAGWELCPVYDCTVTDGSSVSSTYPCVCGSSVCAETYEQCTAATSTCAAPTCSISDGSESSDVYPCACGSSLCEEAHQRCDASGSTCDTPVCTETDGSATSSVYPCACGSSICFESYQTCTEATSTCETCYPQDNSRMVTPHDNGFPVGTNGCTGHESIGLCMFYTLAEAQDFCTGRPSCTAVVKAGQPDYCGGYGCFLPMQGPVVANASWESGGGQTWIKSDCNQVCVDVSHGAVGADGSGCPGYSTLPSSCGDSSNDDSDFSAADMCCSCGGGRDGTQPQACPSYEYNVYYVGNDASIHSGATSVAHCVNICRSEESPYFTYNKYGFCYCKYLQQSRTVDLPQHGSISGRSCLSVTEQCETDTLQLSTGFYGSELSWSILDGDSVHCAGSSYQSRASETIACCLKASTAYTLVCEDSFGDGWNGASITIGQGSFCGTFRSGSVQTAQFVGGNKGVCIDLTASDGSAFNDGLVGSCLDYARSSAGPAQGACGDVGWMYQASSACCACGGGILHEHQALDCGRRAHRNIVGWTGQEAQMDVGTEAGAWQACCNSCKSQAGDSPPCVAWVYMHNGICRLMYHVGEYDVELVVDAGSDAGILTDAPKFALTPIPTSEPINQDCEIDTLQISTGVNGQDISWSILDGGAVHCEGSFYASESVKGISCCLRADTAYSLKCRDSSGNGWSGAYMTIGKDNFCDSGGSGPLPLITFIGGNLAGGIVAPVPDSSLVFYLHGGDCSMDGEWRDRRSHIRMSVPSGAECEADYVHLAGTAISAPLPTSPNAMQSVTYVIRVRLQYFPSNNGWVMSQSPDDGWPRGLAVSDVRLGGVGQTPGVFDSSLGSPPIGEWVVLVAVWTEGGECQTWLNHVAGTMRECSNTYDMSEESLIIGGRGVDDLDHNPSSLDVSHAFVYNTALSVEEINDIVSELSGVHGTPAGYDVQPGVDGGSDGWLAWLVTTLVGCADACDETEPCAGFTYIHNKTECRLLSSLNPQSHPGRDTFAKQPQAPCDTTDGSGLSSAYPCACGTAVCRSNEQCNAGSSECIPAACSALDGGSFSTTYPCSCGTATCEYGMCNATSSSCSAGAMFVFNGRCGDNANSAPITTLAGCSAAAVALQLADSSTAADDRQVAVSNDPPFCYFEAGELKLNPAGNNTGDCSANDPCLCALAPCDTTDGSGYSTVYPCACGAGTCMTDEKCVADSDYCMPAPCDTTDGSGYSTVYPCTCGASTCVMSEMCVEDSDYCMRACETSTVSLFTGAYASELSWVIMEGDTAHCQGGPYSEDNVFLSVDCCLYAGTTYTVECQDSYGDGWNGAYMDIGTNRLCSGFLNGHPGNYLQTMQLVGSNPEAPSDSPSAAPTPQEGDGGPQYPTPGPPAPTHSPQWTPTCPNGEAAECCDVDGSCTNGDDGYCCQGEYYCSNDGEAYAISMGGILCPPPLPPVCTDSGAQCMFTFEVLGMQYTECTTDHSSPSAPYSWCVTDPTFDLASGNTDGKWAKCVPCS